MHRTTVAGTGPEGSREPQDIRNVAKKMPPADANIDNQSEHDDAFLRLRRENLARLLIRTFDVMERHVLEGFRSKGFDLKRTWLPILRNVSVEGSRITEIADAAGLSKQTVGPLVRELAAEGILTIRRDPSDGRAKIVRYTKAGLDGLRVGVAVLTETEERYAGIVGRDRLATLRETLIDLLRALE